MDYFNFFYTGVKYSWVEFYGSGIFRGWNFRGATFVDGIFKGEIFGSPYLMGNTSTRRRNSPRPTRVINSPRGPTRREAILLFNIVINLIIYVII